MVSHKPMASEPRGRFALYKQTLAAVSARTGTPLPSLILSFGILHELTAVVPLVGLFYGAKTLGIGEHVMSSILADEQVMSSASAGHDVSRQEANFTWARQKVKTWVDEGDRWAIRIGRRYGIFGYDKRPPGTIDDIEEMAKASGHIAGDVANAVFAYGATKALLPLRIGASIYLAPMFSRSIIEPFRKLVIQPFRRKI